MLEKVLELFKKLDNKITQIPYRYCKLGIAGLSVLLFLMMLKLNIMTPMWVDDYDYTYSYKTLEKIHSFSDIIESQYVHYHVWGGRVVAHFIAHFLLMLPAFVADVLNALVFVIFIYLIYLHVKGLRAKHSFSLFLLIFLITWFTQQGLGETILWITGSANYLWCTSIILLFLLPYRFYFNIAPPIKNKRIEILGSLLLFIGGIIAGWTNENTGLALCLMLFLFVLFKYKETRKISMWRLAGFFGVVIGYIMLILAPGNYVREKVYHVDYGWFVFFYRFMLCSHRYSYSVGYLIVISFIFLVLIFRYSSFDRQKFITFLSIYLIGSLVALYAMLGAPVFPPRAMFGVITLFTIFFSAVYFSLIRTVSFVRYAKYIILPLICFSFVVDFYFSYKGLNVTNKKWCERETLINEALAKGDSTVYVNLINVPSRFHIEDHVFCLGNMSKYYGISIQVDGKGQ